MGGSRKVLIVATVTNHIKRFHIPYLKWFKEQGYEVHVASRGEGKIEYCDKHYDLPFERFPIKMKNLKTYKQLKKIIEENDYEIIHCHTPVGGVLTRFAAKKARKNGTKVIYTAHGFHFYKGAPIMNWIIYYPIEKICARWTDCLITINQEDFELAKKKIKANKIEYINGVGVNTQRFKKEISENEKEKKRNEFGIAKDDVVFSYVAELNKNKNQMLLIEAFKLLKIKNKNIKLLLVGEGPLLEEYHNIIKESNLENDIKLLGKRKDINEILSITDIYLASSLREGLPVNIMEAMYKGLPVIVTENRGHKELIKNDINGILTKNESNEFFEKMQNLLNNKNKRIEYGKKSKKMVNKFLLENIEEKMHKIYAGYF